MTAEQVIFYLFGFGAVCSAVAVILPPLGRNPIHSAMSLIISFFFLAGCYALLHAHLLSALQIIVYAGAIMILFTFVIMLLNLGDDELGEPQIKASKVAGSLIVLFIFGKLLTVLTAVGDLGIATWQKMGPDGRPIGAIRHGANLMAVNNEGFGSTTEVGRLMYTSFMVPFELVSVLLLVAAVGAVMVAKRRLTPTSDGEDVQ